MNRFIKLLFVWVILAANSFGQSENPSYYVNTVVGAGYGIFLSDLDMEGLNKSGFNGSVRFMWQPEHKLQLGIETGFIQFYSFSQSNVNTGEFGITDIKSKLNGVPILLVVSMNIIDRFDISVGSGPYILYSTVDSHNNKVTSSEINTGFLISGTYLRPLNNSISLGGELK